MKKIVDIIWLTATFALLLSCAAPHDNPLDPESDYYVAPPESLPASPTPIFHTDLRSVHISRIFPTTDSYTVLAELWPDSALQIDSAMAQYDGRPSVDLAFTNESKWAAAFTSSYFNDDHLESVIGVPFTFHVWTPKDSFTVGPEYLFRVLQETPTLVSPASSEVTGPRPNLAWNRFDALYPFTFQASIERVLEFQIVAHIWSSDSLLATQNSLPLVDSVMADSLEDGNYYWTIFVYDNYGNSTRSREGYFTVSAGAGL
ncbi:MAG: hypothetical protein IPG71_05030 [bacterium]|nr:hypothetical protein [bacterium]